MVTKIVCIYEYIEYYQNLGHKFMFLISLFKNMSLLLCMITKQLISEASSTCN